MEEVRIVRLFGATVIHVTKWKERAYIIRVFEDQSCVAAIIAFTTADDALTMAHEFDPAPIGFKGTWR